MAHQKNLQKYIKMLLAFLIEKYEQSTGFKEDRYSSRRPQLIIKNSPIADDYYDETNYEKRKMINQAMTLLSEKGVIEVTWAKFQDKQLAERVYLNTDQLQLAYELACLESKSDKMQRIQDILSPLRNHTWTWVRDWWGEINNNLLHRKAGNLDLNDPQSYQDLVTVLNALPNNPESTTIRVFSQRLFGDSKRFERIVQNRLLYLLKHRKEEALDIQEDYLDSIGLVSNPKLVLFTGDAEITINGSLIKLQTIKDGLGITLAAVNEMEINNIYASQILCVENLTSYYDLIRSKDALIIYVGGFPHKGTQKLLSKVKGYLENNTQQISIFHAGDLDYGGIRIFEYLRKHFFPDLQPYLMDVVTYEANLDLGSPFNNDYAMQLTDLLGNPQYIAWEELIQSMLKHRIRIEQETIILRKL